MVRPSDQRCRAIGIALISFPCSFFAILLVWSWLESRVGGLEVSQFIREHHTLVAQRLSDPRVHSLSLTHAPEHWGTLLIQFDVDDRATYERLENDLDQSWNLRFTPRWKTDLRSQERLGNNLGFAAAGIGELEQGIVHAMVAAVLATIFSCVQFTRSLGSAYPGTGSALGA